MKIIKIETCKDCKHLQETRDYSPDSFEMLFRWDCKKEKKNIRRYIEVFDGKIPIPNWCSLEDMKEND